MRQPRLRNKEASTNTLRCKTKLLNTIRHTVSKGDDSTQLASEVATSSHEDRKAILDSLKSMPGNFKVEVPVSTSLAIKADLNIPWSKLRVMRK